MKIGKNIERIRNAQNLTQGFVAEKLGEDLGEYIKIENDEVDIKLSTLEALAGILSCTPIDILQYEEDIPGIRNYFYNHNGNAGVNINSQGVDQDLIRKCYKELYQNELIRVPILEKLLRDNDISFDF